MWTPRGLPGSLRSQRNRELKAVELLEPDSDTPLSRRWTTRDGETVT